LKPRLHLIVADVPDNMSKFAKIQMLRMENKRRIVLEMSVDWRLLCERVFEMRASERGGGWALLAAGRPRRY
jgi:hypothetical protein